MAIPEDNPQTAEKIALGKKLFEDKRFSADGTISCAHCVMTIERELTALDGVDRVAGDLETKEVTIEWSEPATWDDIRSRLTEINYAPAG